MATLFGGQPCVDPVQLARSCAEADPPLPADRFWGKANSFSVPLGREPGRGHILLKKSALDAIDLATDHDLTFSGSDAAHVVVLQRITLLRAECVDPGGAADPEAAYLCEVVDRRHHLAMAPVDRAYNLRNPKGDAYLSGSLNSSTPWTWQQVVTDLAAVLGIGAPTLPFAPTGAPESLAYFAPCSAWAALCDVLDRLACAIEYSPESDAFAIIRLGATDATAEAAQFALAGDRLWDGYPADAARGWRPEKVRVIFPRLPVPTEGTSPVYTKDITLVAAPGVVTGKCVQIRDGTVARAATGTPSNSAALDAIAAERAADWLRRRTGYERPLARVYRDFHSAATFVGSTVGKVVYDDRGGPFATAIGREQLGRLEDWRPNAGDTHLWGEAPGEFGGSGGICPQDPYETEGICTQPCGTDLDTDDLGPLNCDCDEDLPRIQAIQDVFVADGILYVVRGYIGIVSVGGRAALKWCTVVGTAEGCAACPGDPPSCCGGSGSGGGGHGAAPVGGDGVIEGPGDPDAPGTSDAGQSECCPDGYDDPISVVLVGPFGADCADVTFSGLATYYPFTGRWQGALDSDEGLVNRFSLWCAGGVWSWQFVTETVSGGFIRKTGGTLEESGGFLTGSASVAAQTGCPGGTVSVAATHPCASAGSGSGGGDPSCACCDPESTDPASLSVTSETCPGACGAPVELVRASEQIYNNTAFTCFGETCTVGIVCSSGGGNPVTWSIDMFIGGAFGTAILAQNGLTLTGTITGFFTLTPGGCSVAVEITLPAGCHTPC